jgi:hypothetical protein
MWNSRAEEKVFIIPRNQNIKKLYVYLAFSPIYNEDQRLINKPLHDRLKYKILSTVEEAFYEAQKYLLNSPLGKDIFKSKDSYLAMIAKYTKEVEKFLFDPKKQDLLTGEDRITLPDFKPPLSKESQAYERTKNNALPKPLAMAKNNLTFNDFTVYFVDPAFGKERITEDTVTLVRKGPLKYMTSRTLYSRSFLFDLNPISPEIDTQETENVFFILHNVKYNSDIQIEERGIILDYVTAKYLVDLYIGKDLPIEALASLFPSLNEKGIFNEFYPYAKMLREGNTVRVNEEASGVNRPVDEIPFYNQVLNLKGETVKIDPTGINVYNIFGEKENTYAAVPG